MVISYEEAKEWIRQQSSENCPLCDSSETSDESGESPQPSQP